MHTIKTISITTFRVAASVYIKLDPVPPVPNAKVEKHLIGTYELDGNGSDGRIRSVIAKHLESHFLCTGPELTPADIDRMRAVLSGAGVEEWSEAWIG